MNALNKRMLAVAVVAGVMAASASVTATAAPAQEKVIVIYKNGMSAAVQADIQRAGGVVDRQIKRVNAFGVRVSRAGLDALKRNPNVKLVEADAERHTMAASAVRAPVMLNQAETVPYGIPMVQADQLSDVNAANRRVCIIDSGIDGGHEDLAANRLSGVNLTTSGEWFTDEGGHGSHVAGTIAAIGGNGVGVVGVNPGGHLDIYVAKVFDASGSADSSVVMAAVSACADAGANVINMSLGGGYPTWGERRLFEQLAAQGILVVASAGNTGARNANFPAAYAAVMSVGAVDEQMQRASFSTYNRDVEITGPGVAVLSTVPPNLDSLGQLTVGETSYDNVPMTGSPRVNATGALYDFGTGEADDAGVAGKMCLIQRGNISFAEKVTRCQANGGVGAVVFNNEPGMLFGTLGDAVTAIPSVGTSDVIGATLLAQVGQSASVSVEPDPTQYAYYNGTSMSAPHVSGVAALVWSYFPSCSGNRIRQALNTTAMDLGAPGRDIEYGHGLVQAKAAFDWLSQNGCAAN